VLAVSYFHAMTYRPDDPEWEGRDRFLLSIDAGLDQRGVEGDGVVADREQEAVPALPFRIVRAVATSTP
jgi:hypothetical protein